MFAIVFDLVVADAIDTMERTRCRISGAKSTST